MSQDEVWKSEEGDRWFQRSNLKNGTIPDFDWPLQIIRQIKGLSSFKRIAELGCANGWRLDALMADVPNALFYGVDASLAAIEDGKSRYPQLKLETALLDDVPARDPFDLVIVAGVMCVVGRDRLTRAIAEIDRLVADKGYLLIADFLPDSTCKRLWHHQKDKAMYTHKQDYRQNFLSLQFYKEVNLVTFDCSQASSHSIQHSPGQSRFACSLMRKDFDSIPEMP